MQELWGKQYLPAPSQGRSVRCYSKPGAYGIFPSVAWSLSTPVSHGPATVIPPARLPLAGEATLSIAPLITLPISLRGASPPSPCDFPQEKVQGMRPTPFWPSVLLLPALLSKGVGKTPLPSETSSVENFKVTPDNSRWGELTKGLPSLLQHCRWKALFRKSKCSVGRDLLYDILM